MLDSAHKVDSNFYAELFGEDFTEPVSLVLPNNSTKAIPVRFFKKKRSAETEIEYPLITVQNYTFRRDASFGINTAERPEFSAISGTEGKFFKTPVRHIFPYDISFATKSEKELSAFKDWVRKNFMTEETRFFLFDKISVTLSTTGTVDTYGETVRYDVTLNDIPRSDGIFEVVAAFVLKPFLYTAPVVGEINEGIEFHLNR